MTRNAKRVSALVLACALAPLVGCEVSPVPKAPLQAAREIPQGVDARPLQLSRIVTKLPLGESIGQIQYGWGCFPGRDIGWRGGSLNITDEELTDIFRQELGKANYPVVGDPYALFEDPSGLTAELLVGGRVDKAQVNLCFPFSGSPNINVGNTRLAKGGVFMHVTWEVYSREERRVIYRTTTEGSFASDELVNGGAPVFLRNAFAANVRNLLSDAGFHKIVVKPPVQHAL